MTSEQLGSWIQIAAWFAFLIGSVIGSLLAWRKLHAPESSLPQPVIVASEKEFVQRPEFERHRDEVDARFSAAAAARQQIHKAHESFGRELSALQTTANHTSNEVVQLRADLSKIHDRFDNLPARMAEQLNKIIRRP